MVNDQYVQWFCNSLNEPEKHDVKRVDTLLTVVLLWLEYPDTTLIQVWCIRVMNVNMDRVSYLHSLSSDYNNTNRLRDTDSRVRCTRSSVSMKSITTFVPGSTTQTQEETQITRSQLGRHRPRKYFHSN